MSNNNMAIISKLTRGMVFLGTPFRGAKLAFWAELLRKIVSVISSTNRTLIPDLDEKSSKLRARAVAFPAVLSKRAEGERIGVSYFSETLKYKNFMVIYPGPLISISILNSPDCRRRIRLDSWLG
jgi:hypothetical protein